MRIRISTTFLFFFIFILQGYGSTGKVGFKPDRNLTTLTIDQWTSRNGLISNNLTSVFQSSDYFLWVTSFNGIDRFDGVDFRLYDKIKIPIISSNAFYKTFEDSRGILWFCSQSSGIVAMHDNKFTQVLPVGRNSLSVRAIAEDNEGNLWIGTNNEGIYIYKDSVLTKLKIDEFELSLIMDIVISSEGIVYIATNGEGLLIYNDGKIDRLTTSDGLNHNTVNKLHLTADGMLLIGTLDGIYYIMSNERGVIEDAKGLEINDIFVDDYRIIWAATEKGLYRFNENFQLMESLTVSNGLPSSQVSDLIFDHENSLWLSTKKSGLIRLREGFFQNIREEEGLTSGNVNIIAEHQGALYIGCDDGNVSLFHDGKLSKYEINTKKFDLGIRDFCFLDNGEVLIASYRGLLRKKNDLEQLIDLSQFGSGNEIRRVLKAQDGTVWLATRSSGILKLTDFKLAKIYDSSRGLKADYILALEESTSGDIFVGTHSGGMSIIRKNGNIENYMIEEGKSGILIFNIHIIDDRTCWVSTNIGVYKFENNVFTKVTLDEKIYAETIFDICIVDGFAWLSSNIGLIRIKMEDLHAHNNGKIDKVPGKLFNRFDGMASQECTGATRMSTSSEGKILVPTLGGATIVDPSDLQFNTEAPNVFITDFEVDFQPLPFDLKDRLTLEPGLTRFEFSFTALSFIAPPKIQFMYKLQGIDNDWINSGNERRVVYTNLPKGNYTFMVKATNNDGVWNEIGDKLDFRIKPYFYETTFFYLGLLLLIGLIIWGIIILRVRNIEKVNVQLRKLNEELDRFVYSASHDLRAPLSSIMGLVEIARLETTMEAKQHCLDMISSSVKKLDGFINDIIDYSRNQRLELQPEKLDLEAEVMEALAELKYLDKDNKIEKVIEGNGSGTFITDGRRLNVILKNVISNAIRYHKLDQKNPFIKIQIENTGSKASISIEDNGIGIDEIHLQNIFKMFYRADENSKGSGLGLYIVKETIEKLGGEIKVTSKLDQGSKFIVTLPQLNNMPV